MRWFWMSLTGMTTCLAWLGVVGYPGFGYPAGPTILVLCAVASVPSAYVQRLGGALAAVLGWATAVAAVGALASHALGWGQTGRAGIIAAAVLATLTLLVWPLHAGSDRRLS